MATYNSILVGVDFSPHSAAALKQAIRIGTGYGASLHAMHVIDEIVASELEGVLSDVQPDLRQSLLSDARMAWSEFARGVPGAERISFEVTIDHCHAGVLKAVRAVKADLLVLGAFGRESLAFGVGSLAKRAVRRSPSDVLLVRDTPAGAFRKIVACVDFSPNSALALRRAAGMAQLDHAELHVIHVFSAPWHQLHYRAPTLEMSPQFIKQYSDGLRRRLTDFARQELAGMPDLKFHCELSDYGSHRIGIVEYARQVGADLIVLGSRGRANMRDFLLGSTAEKVLNRTSCSVLAVKDPTQP